MAFDFKKEYRDLYQAKTKPMRVEVPAMTFAAVAGTGDPNEEGGAYARALALLYGFSYTVKMAKMGAWQPDGYFDYVVPPLEGLWWGGAGAFDGTVIADKSALSWVSLIRQPDFVTPDVFIKVCELLVQKSPSLLFRSTGATYAWSASLKGLVLRLCIGGRTMTSLRPSLSCRHLSRAKGW